MPTGFYIRTEKHRQALRVKRKGSGIYIRTKPAWNKGKKFPFIPRKKGGIPWNKGVSGYKTKPASEERKRKIGEANKLILKGKKRLPFSDQWCKNISKTHKGKHYSLRTEFKKGRKHSNWKGGISFEPYPLGWTKTFKEQIRYRDNYKCQLCGIPEVECIKKLNVHHKDYCKDNLKPENLITLCNSCHIKTNHNRKYWEEYFGNQNNLYKIS